MAPPTKPLRRTEFIALMAGLFAIMALSIDAMLPALPEIAQELSPSAPNRAQLLITSFVLGLGLGTFVVGPLADAFGRKAVILSGFALFVLGAMLAFAAPRLEWVLAARVMMGLGAAAPRVAGTAMIRDLFKGRDMAQVMSVIMTVFMIVPAIAPLLGQGIISLAGWRAIFLALALAAMALSAWLWRRQPETLPSAARQSLALRPMWRAAGTVLAMPIVRAAIALQILIMGGLFASLSSVQGIFAQSFGRAQTFPLWFAVIAAGAALGSVINARYVKRFGMRHMLGWALTAGLAASIALLALQFLPAPRDLRFGAYMLWAILTFGSMGMTMGNLNALALEQLGHVAGLAASLITALSTVFAALLAIPVGLAFDGSERPLLLAFVLFGLAAQVILRKMPPR